MITSVFSSFLGTLDHYTGSFFSSRFSSPNQEAGQVQNINALSSELIYTIFLFLGESRDFTNLSLVNKKWNSEVKGAWEEQYRIQVVKLEESEKFLAAHINLPSEPSAKLKSSVAYSAQKSRVLEKELFARKNALIHALSHKNSRDLKILREQSIKHHLSLSRQLLERARQTIHVNCLLRPKYTISSDNFSGDRSSAGYSYFIGDALADLAYDSNGNGWSQDSSDARRKLIREVRMVPLHQIEDWREGGVYKREIEGFDVYFHCKQIFPWSGITTFDGIVRDLIEKARRNSSGFRFNQDIRTLNKRINSFVKRLFPIRICL